MTPRAATATAIYIDEFDVTRSAGPLFDDSFNRSITLSGGAGTTLSSGVNFAGGGAASYFVHGKVPERTANSGQALVSASNGVLISHRRRSSRRFRWPELSLRAERRPPPRTP
jgi:hypothetical protein